MKETDAIYLEDNFFPNEKKASRQSRKIASKTDRSSHKYTDLKQKQKHQHLAYEQLEQESNLDPGMIIHIAADTYKVLYNDCIYSCTLRGNLKKNKSHIRQIAIIGDHVLFQKDTNNTGTIWHIKPRTSTLSRPFKSHSNKQHLIAANIEKLLITVAFGSPKIDAFLIDRYIISAQIGNLQPIIVCNKSDLLNQESLEIQKDRELFEKLQNIYPNLDIPILAVSAHTSEGIPELLKLMKESTSVFSGPSGVGKSSLINALAQTSLEVGPLSQKNQSGMHTTTQASLIRLPYGGFCIDTPGITDIGLHQIPLQDIRLHFVEIAECGYNCKFQNCLHRHEPHCAVKEAVNQGNIDPLRYESYLALFDYIQSRRP